MDLDAELRRAQLRRVRLPLRHVHAAAHGVESEREVVVVELTDADGLVGWGECPTLREPTYTSEYTDGAWELLTRWYVPALLAGRRPEVAGHRSARWAIDTALADLKAQHAGLSLRDLWGGSAGSRQHVPSTAVVGVTANLDDLVVRTGAVLDRGHRSVKVKIGPTWNVDPLRALRTSWPDLDLAADANGSLPAGDDRLLDALDTIGLSYLEQPLPVDDLVGSARLIGRLHTPIVLDESVTSAGAVATIAAVGAASGVNAKPGRLGLEAVAVARAARAAGLEVACGGMLETGVGRAAALAVAALPECTLPADLGPSESYFGLDLTEPFTVDQYGMLEVPGGQGLGVVPDPVRLEAATVDRLTLRP